MYMLSNPHRKVFRCKREVLHHINKEEEEKLLIKRFLQFGVTEKPPI